MARSQNQRGKILYVLKILSEHSDKEHCLRAQQIIEMLEEFGIKTERKTIYSDINQLNRFGYKIVNRRSKKDGGYYLAERTFELPELKLLVDAVLASRFITVKKSRELIHKLEQLAGIREAEQLERQVYVAGRIKTQNESIYFNVDKIHKAIQLDTKISFLYMEWTAEKELVPRKKEKYVISPWALTWQDENYYLIGYDTEADKIKHYRVDKMGAIEILEEELREGGDKFEKFDINEYIKKIFGMFGGTEESVTIQMPERMTGIAIDRFGKDIIIRKRDNDNITVRVQVAVSEPFFGWITGLGAKVKILSPKLVANEYQKYLRRILDGYEVED